MAAPTSTGSYPLDDLFPAALAAGLRLSGRDFVARLGEAAMNDITLDVMLGKNVRTRTDPLTQQRIAEVAGGVVTMFVNAADAFGDARASDELIERAQAQLDAAPAGDLRRVWPAQWVLGVTGKGVQNVLRSDPRNRSEYLRSFRAGLDAAAATLTASVGQALAQIKVAGRTWSADWRLQAHLFSAIGSAALAIRGSDKSRYGKLFEKLVMGAALHLCGFAFAPNGRDERGAGTFWFADKTDGRDCDARVVVKPGQLASFDIGFIGIGNPEIVRDKLSRFAREVERDPAAREETSRTFVVIDAYSKHPRSNTLKLAEMAGAKLVEMSVPLWPRNLARKLHDQFDVDFELLHAGDDAAATEAHIRARMARLDVCDFLKSVDLAALEDSEDEE